MRALLLCLLALPCLASPSPQPTSTLAAPSTSQLSSSQPSSTAASAPTEPRSEPIPSELLPFLPMVDVHVSAETPKLGDVVSYELCVERRSEVYVQFPEIAWPEGVRVRQENPKSLRDNPTGTKTECHSDELQIVGLGNIEIPAPVLRFWKDPRQKASVAGPAKTFQIAPTLSKPEDINDSFTPRVLPTNSQTAFFWLFGASFLALLLGIAAWYRLRRRTQTTQAPTKPNTKTDSLSTQEGVLFWQNAARQIRQEMSKQLAVQNASPREILTLLQNSEAFAVQKDMLTHFWSSYELFLFSGKPIMLSRDEVLSLLHVLCEQTTGVSP